VTDLATCETLIPMIPPDRIPVAESGIRTAADVKGAKGQKELQPLIWAVVEALGGWDRVAMVTLAP
jgi:hypothetical protein